ncbi:MAG: winged helix-turn-helix transcriptional regulator [Thermoplasmata archaeon]|nr:MAG: winged helix-turn-helix transcriptional regulator [Thermoplasmata archaeon]
MSVEHFKSRVDALSGEHSLKILFYLRDSDWSIALDIARELRLHPTTVARYLTKMHNAGIISKRPKCVKTGKTFEYRLKSKKIDLTLDLSEETDYKSPCSIVDLISRIIDRLEKVGCPFNQDIFKDKRERETFTLIISKKGDEISTLSKKDKESFTNALESLIKFSEKSYGKSVTQDIVLSAWRSMEKTAGGFMPEYIQEVLN